MNEVLRTLLGTLVLMTSIVLFVYCCYKLALCREEEDKKRIQTITVSQPKIVVTQPFGSKTVCSNCGHSTKYSSLV